MAVKRRYHDKKETIKQCKNQNILKIPHQELHIRKQSVRNILKCNWYMKKANTMNIQKIK